MEVYIVTRCEEHDSYVEKVFINKDNAEKYAEQFNNNEDVYSRDITKCEIEDYCEIELHGVNKE